MFTTRQLLTAITAATALGIGASAAQAVTFNFEGNGGPFDSNANTAMVSQNGIDITLTANGAGTISGNASGLGVNSLGAGDSPSEIDDVLTSETVTATFAQNVYLNFFAASGFGAGDDGSVQEGAGAASSFTSSGVTNLSGSLLSAGDALTFGINSGDYGLNALSVTLNPLLYFDLRAADIEAIDEASSMTLATQGGLTPSLFTPDGVLNRTASGFGVNATPSGDDTDQVDSDALDSQNAPIDESIEITFDVDAYLEFLQLTAFGGDDLLLFTYADGTTQLFGGDAEFPGTDILDVGSPLVLAGETVTIQHLGRDGGNGFSFDGFGASLAPASSPVPEPATAGLIAGAMGLLMVRRRRLR